MTVRVDDFEMIVGNKGKHFLRLRVQSRMEGRRLDPVYGRERHLDTAEDGLYHNPDGEELKLTISPEDVKDFRPFGILEGRTVSVTADAWQPEGYEDLCRFNVCRTSPAPSHEHDGRASDARLSKDHPNGLRGHPQSGPGLAGCPPDNLMGDDLNRYMFYKSATIICDAATILVKRYGQACFDKAPACTDQAARPSS